MPLPALLPILLSVGGAIVGGILNSVNSKAQHNANTRNIQASLNAQKEENQLTREYNLNLAKQQNEWNIEQWNRENAYNDPSAQIERLRSAGLNADMMYGGQVSGNVAASSPSMTAGASAVPMDWSALAGRQTFAESQNQILQNRLLEAQIKNVESVTDKNVSDTDLNKIDAQYRAAILQGQLSESNVRVNLGMSQIDRNKVANSLDAQSIEESKMRMKEMQQAISESDARIQQMRNDYEIDKIRVALEKARTDAQVADYASQIGLRGSQKKQIDDLIEKICLAYDDAHEVHVENLGIVKAERGIIEFDQRVHTSNEWDEEIGWYANICKYIDKFTDACDGLIAPATQAVSRGKGSGITINNNM